jgi:predicted HicB family RNase H-like nuclease
LPKNNLVVYKGFYGSVNFCAADQYFYGKIEGVTDLVTFEGDSVTTLQSAFQESVDEYITLCKAHKKPF